MKRSLSSCFMIAISLVFAIFMLDQVSGTLPDIYSDGVGVIKVSNKKRFVEAYRKIPWCVNGIDEPEFQKYPLNEFAPYLRRNDEYVRPKNAQFIYKTELRRVISAVEHFHKDKYLLNTAHFTFAASKRRSFNEGSDLQFTPIKIEGLIVQINFAPYGVGLPTGSFLHQEDLPCSDCVHPHGRPVACKKKTYLNFMHPTILVYHHKMRTTQFEKDLHKNQEQELHYQKFCLNADFSKITSPKEQACETAGDCDKCSFPKQEKHCIATPPKPNPNKCENDTNCDMKSDPPEECKLEEIERKEGHESYIFKEKQFVGKTTEIHSNLVWFTHPCHTTRVIRFLFLVVHSFAKGHYYVVQSEFAINLPKIAKDDRNPMFPPSPIFTGFVHTCENKEIEYTYVKPEDGNGNIDFDFSKSYEECIRNRSKVEEVFCKGNVPNFRSQRFSPPPLCANAPGTSIAKDPLNKIDDLLTSSITKRKCPTCPPLPPTTTYISTTTEVPFIKRKFHGGINFVTNFCVMPITVFVARFYKETFNLHSFKGVKLWYWIHLFGSGGSSVLMYFGYFSEGFVDDFHPHVIFGNIYIMILAFAYITAWARHKNPKLSGIAEIIHGISGYSCFALAICCMMTVEGGLDPIIHVIVFSSIGILLVFYIGMTAHICSLDSRFGMTPKRRHFPVVEVRFEDIPVPGNVGRIVVIILLSIVVLSLCVTTIFF